MWCKFGHVTPRKWGSRNLCGPPSGLTKQCDQSTFSLLVDHSTVRSWVRGSRPVCQTRVCSLDLGTTTVQKCAVLPRRARIEGSETFVSLNSRLKRNKEQKEGEEEVIRYEELAL